MIEKFLIPNVQVYSDGSVPIEELARMPASKYRTMNSAAQVVRLQCMCVVGAVVVIGVRGSQRGFSCCMSCMCSPFGCICCIAAFVLKQGMQLLSMNTLVLVEDALLCLP